MNGSKPLDGRDVVFLGLGLGYGAVTLCSIMFLPKPLQHFFPRLSWGDACSIADIPFMVGALPYLFWLRRALSHRNG